MKDFDDIYTESPTEASLQLGFDRVVGRLLLTGFELDQYGERATTYPTLTLLGETGTLMVGEPHLGQPGKLLVGGQSDQDATITLAGATVSAGGARGSSGHLTLKDRSGDDAVTVEGEDATLILRAFEVEQGTRLAYPTLTLLGETGTVMVGQPYAGQPGKLLVGGQSDGDATIRLEAATVTAGGARGSSGRLTLKNRQGEDGFALDGADATLIVVNGDRHETIRLEGAHGNLILGGDQEDGDVTLRSASGEDAIALSASAASITAGGAGTTGDLSLRTSSGNDAVALSADDASVTVGGVGTNGDVVVKDEHDVEKIHVYGSSGDIEFLNADVAEEFDISDEIRPHAGPGTVMTMDGKGALMPCERPYDQCVLGVVAGAGGYRPGIVLDKRQAANRLPVAMVGKAYCLLDADSEPIAVGDMLTTSDRRGHAMKAVDRERAFGAVIGKALSPVPRGRKLAPVLVNLQ